MLATRTQKLSTGQWVQWVFNSLTAIMGDGDSFSEEQSRAEQSRAEQSRAEHSPLGWDSNGKSVMNLSVFPVATLLLLYSPSSGAPGVCVCVCVCVYGCGCVLVSVR